MLLVMLLKLFIIYLSFLSYELQFHIKGTPSGLRKFWANESPFKLMKNAYYLP